MIERKSVSLHGKLSDFPNVCYQYNFAKYMKQRPEDEAVRYCDLALVYRICMNMSCSISITVSQLLRDSGLFAGGRSCVKTITLTGAKISFLSTHLIPDKLVPCQ